MNGLSKVLAKLQVNTSSIKSDGLLSDVQNYSSIDYQMEYVNRKFEYRYKDCWTAFRLLGFRNLFKLSELSITSVGCGPCAELVAVQEYLSDKKITVMGYDICDWSRICALINIPFGIKDINEDCSDLQSFDLIMCHWTVQFLETLEKYELFIDTILNTTNVLFVINQEHKLVFNHHNGLNTIHNQPIYVKKQSIPTDCNYTVSALLYSRRRL